MKKFEDLKTIKAQKMRIVRDAILQIKSKLIIPGRGGYFNFSGGNYEARRGVEKDLQKLLLTGNPCECCAKGSLFAACVINTDKVKTNDKFDQEYFQKQKLSKWFSADELDTIETAFEGAVIKDTNGIFNLYSPNYIDNLEQKAEKFYDKYKTDKGRMLAILNNILKNGFFKL